MAGQNSLDDIPFASLTSVIELIGPYAVERELGGGATGRVLACKDTSLDRPVAIKLLHEDLLHDATAVARFQREGQVLAQLNSPHIVRVFQVGVHGKVPYLVMERVEGADAEATLKKDGPFALERAIAIGRDVARALAAVHGAGLIHRDVKPSNVLLAPGGAKLVDFGLAAPIQGSAQLTQIGTVPGTAAIMAPERLRGVCDASSDLYALGCTLYALAAGRMPFERGSALEVLAAHVNEPAPRLPGGDPLASRLADLVQALMAKRAEDRPKSAADVTQALDAMLGAPASADALVKKLEGLLGPDGEIPKLPDVPSMTDLMPLGAGDGAGQIAPPRTVAIAAAAASGVLLMLLVPLVLLRPNTGAAANATEQPGTGQDGDLDRALTALTEEHADGAIDTLAAWPDASVTKKLLGLVQTGDWWERHHALTVLERRNESDGVDVSALGVRDLTEGPTCNKRKHGLGILKERGSGKAALAAIDAGQRRSDNGCIWFTDWDAARRAVRGR